MDKEQLACDLREILDDRESLKKEIKKLKDQLRETGGRGVDEVAAENVELKNKVNELRGQVNGLQASHRRDRRKVQLLVKERIDMTNKWINSLRDQANQFDMKLADMRIALQDDEEE